MRRPAPSSLPLLLLLGGSVACRLAPTRSVDADRDLQVSPAELERDVRELAGGRFAPRDILHPENLDRAATWIASELRTTGAAVREQPFQVAGRTYRNVLAEFGPDTPERLVIGAHYDTAGDQPGADDDASGVAGVLALARLLAARPPPIRVELAAWALEEPPAFGTSEMGSAAHASALAAEGKRVRLAISVEMIGFFSDEPGSQHLPPLLGAFYPTRGRFIAVIGKWGQTDWVRRLQAGMRRGTRLPIRSLSAPGTVEAVGLSDHRSFWAHGFDAVMVTDTAFMRNARYHTKRDLPETLDYVRMAEVVKGLRAAVEALGADSPR